MSYVVLQDIEPKAREVIEVYLGATPTIEATPDTVVLRDNEGGIAVNSVVLNAEPVDVVEGEVVFRGRGNKLIFCGDMKVARAFIGVTKIHTGLDEPLNANVGDLWIGGE